jgi:hypothetical protein
LIFYTDSSLHTGYVVPLCHTHIQLSNVMIYCPQIKYDNTEVLTCRNVVSRANIKWYYIPTHHYVRAMLSHIALHIGHWLMQCFTVQISDIITKLTGCRNINSRADIQVLHWHNMLYLTDRITIFQSDTCVLCWRMDIWLTITSNPTCLSVRWRTAKF